MKTSTKNNTPDRISVAEAAYRMGVSQAVLRQFLRIGMPFGWVIQDNRERCTYFISRSLFDKYIKEGGDEE